MKNALNYYYSLNPTSIHQVNNNYRCYINNEEYLLTLYTKDNNYEINQLYELSNYLLQNKILCHQIILNNNKEIITIINNNSYILLKIFTEKRSVTINDILFFSNIKISDGRFNLLLMNNWYEMWIKKIDYIEYQMSQFGKKYPIIRESINYYIGLAENAISFFKILNRDIDNDIIVSHKRINVYDGTIEFYNPLNFILDSKVRDISEFIKERFFSGNYSCYEAKKDIYRLNLNNEQCELLFLRLIFPTYYFDCYENIILGNKNEKEIVKIINKNHLYLEFLHEIYLYFKKNSNLPEIDWLIKK